MSNEICVECVCGFKHPVGEYKSMYCRPLELKKGDRVRPATDGVNTRWSSMTGTVTAVWQEGIDTRISVFWHDQEMGRNYGTNLPAYLVLKVSR